MGRVEHRSFGVSASSSPFIGRSAELGALAKLMARDAHRLVTVVGPPGVGKTRLLLEWAAQTDGVPVVDLSRARDAEQVAEATAATLEVNLTAASDAVGRISEALVERPRLVLLDNFEQVAEHAGATVGRWMREAPGARFLVSSREALRIDGERRFELAPMNKREAARLFVGRAEAAGVTIEGDAMRTVDALVDRLDRVPLAIELAAGRTTVLSLAEIDEQLSQGLEVLRSRRRDVDPRHATMRATFEWSWRLLPAWGQAALAQLSVFAGAFDRGAARAVLDLSAHPDAPDALDLLEALRERSLITAGALSEGAARRFRLLASIRELAHEQLDAPAAAELRHARYLIETLGDSTSDVRFAERLEHRDEILLAFDRMVEPEPLEAARLLLAFVPILVQEERFMTYEGMVERAVECARRGGSTELELSTTARLALTYAVTGRDARARELLEAIVQKVRDRPEDSSPELMSAALSHLGAAYWGEGRFDEAERAWTEALPNATANNRVSLAGNLALLQAERGKLEAAEASLRPLFEGEAHASLSQVRFLLAHVRALRGDVAEAAALFERVHDEAPSPARVAHACLMRGAIEIREARHDAARQWLERAKEADRGSERFLESAAEGLLALSAARQGDPVRSAEHLGRSREAARRIHGRGWEAQIARSLSAGVDRLAFAALGAPARLGPRADEAPATREYISDQLIAHLLGQPRSVEPAADGVEVARDGSWIRVGAARPARLSRTPLLRRLLATLAEARAAGDEMPVPVEALVAAGWPNERILPGAASNRLHQAIGRLRRLGLSEALERVEDGYRLSPTVAVESDV